ncbi:MAG: TrkA family potassium uptake protein [Lachnospiraceae bacterium]|nr:TrkA family potassium uptake protein [Lachnospiraceae bacterium]
MKSILIIGLGRLGRHLATKMQQLGNEVMVIDQEASIVEGLSVTFTDANIGDCTNENVIRALGVNNFDICFVTIGDDFQSSLVITSLLKKYNAKMVVAKAKQDIQADLLRKIGADEVVYPELEVAEKLAVRYNADNIFDFIRLTDEYFIYEIPIHASWKGRTIMDLNVRKKYNINIIAIKEQDNLQPSPAADYRFKADDHIIVIGKSEDVFKLTAQK